MNFNNIEFITSANSFDQTPESDLIEIALAGRSNVGKSSFINALVGRNRIAYVGKTPGKTRLLNFFDVDGKFMMVDVPGYGFAHISSEQMIQFGELMEDYFEKRTQLKALVLLVDARHKPSGDDVMMIEFARYHHLNIIVLATKCDKLKNSVRVHCLNVISETLEVPMSSIVEFSSLNKKGLDKIKEQIEYVIDTVK
jgi:GTP-binding protein